MERRDPAHQQSSDGGQLVPNRIGPNITKLPLLPYERALIASVGMSAEDYEEYLRWAQQKQGDLREAEVVAGPAVLVPTLISLAVGVLFTVVGVLLAPKPKALGGQQKQKQIRNKQGDSETGRSRFNPTYGFDTSTELGTYGTPLPIHFGSYVNAEDRERVVRSWPKDSETELLCSPCVDYVASDTGSGGMVVSPSLVWSRMYSMGKGQLFQGMYVVGEKMVSKEDPALAGIWIGNNTLDKIHDQNFAFYYDDEGQEGRLRSIDLLYGTHDKSSSGNPFLAAKAKGYRSWAEPFPAPVCDRERSSGFSMTYSLSNQSAFGVYSPIMNGTDRRPPWRTISLPEASDGDSEERIKNERKKISGGQDRMQASGRGYGRLMGLNKYNGKTRGDKDRPRFDETIQRGDTVEFTILKKRYEVDLYDSGVSVEDLVNESDADRQAADDALQLGEEFMINASRFRVIKRSKDIYEMKENGTSIKLECIEDRKASSQIGFVTDRYFENDICNISSTISVFDKAHVPPNWSPLLKYEVASFRNIRKADVTEIGIKSRVWAQMNGMCNYPTIPTAQELNDQFDQKNVNYTNGVQNQYFTRFSFFTLHMRNVADIKDPTNPSSFRSTQVIFAIRGSEPVDQYNFIRIKPKRAEQYEYRFYPLSSGFLSKVSDNPDKWDQNSVAWVLDTAKGDEFTLVSAINGIGKVEIKGVGRLISIRCALTSPLMLGKRDPEDNEDPYCPPDYCEGFTGRVNLDNDEMGSALDDYREDNEGLGDTCEEAECGESSAAAIARQRVRRQEALWHILPSNSDEAPPDYIKDGFDFECLDCSSTWEDEDAPQLSVMSKGTSCDKPYWAIFEYATQVNEGSYYTGLISRSCDTSAEHQIAYVNESIKPKEICEYPDITMMGLSLRATREFTSLDQPRLCLKQGIAVERLEKQSVSSDFKLKAALTLGPENSRKDPPGQLETKIYDSYIQCDSNDNRVVTVKARISDDQAGSSDPDRLSNEINWMVQWFKGKNRTHSARIKDPDWVGTKVKADWTSRNPHATLIQGNSASIRLPKDYGWVTCYMWPGESNTTNNGSVDNENGLDFGPTSNNDLKRSLSGFKFNSDDQIVNIFANGVKKIRNQNTSGSGNDAKYSVNYEYFWSGKNNLSQEDLDNGEYIQWYNIDDDREEVELDGKDSCPGDTKPPGPGKFYAEIDCGQKLTTKPLICNTQNCTGETVTYEWQWRSSEPDASGGWQTAPGPIVTNESKLIPGTAGYYRCKATCGSTTLKTGQCLVKSKFEDPDPLPTPDPDPPIPEDPKPPTSPKPDDKGGKRPSNNYANLIYWMLTDEDAGAGKVVSTDMVDKDRMILTAKFLERLGLTWDGTLSETTNLRTFATQTAPFFLCNFTVTNGKFTLWPVLPVNKNGDFKNKKVFIKQIFTEGNIIDGSFGLEYLDADDRRPFKASMRYRVMSENQLPEERTLTTICYGGSKKDPTEEFDMTQFCTTPEHALLAARYFMWIRNVVTHTIKLQTVPEVMNGAGPGDFIKLKLENATIQRSNIAAVSEAGALQTPQRWIDGTYDVTYWIAGMDEPSIRPVTVRDNRLINAPEMRNALISPQQSTTCDATETVYQVESVTLEEDGLVELVASYYPVDVRTGYADLYNWLFGLGDYSNASVYGRCGAEPLLTAPIKLKSTIRIQIIIDNSGSMRDVENVLVRMRDTVLKECLLPFYKNDEDLYNNGVRVLYMSQIGVEQTYKAAYWDTTADYDSGDPTTNVINLIFQDEAAPIYTSNAWTIDNTPTNAFIADMSNLNTRFSNYSQPGRETHRQQKYNPGYMRTNIFQVTNGSDDGKNFKSLMKAVENSEGYYTGFYSTKKWSEIGYTYDVPYVNDVYFYMDMIIDAINKLGYNAPSCKR